MNRDHHPISPSLVLNISERNVPVRDGHAICVRVYRRKSMDFKAPLLMYMHGGGYVTGGLETDDALLRRAAQVLDCVIVSVEYRLAPEHPFPQGWQDCYDVAKWVWHHQEDTLRTKSC
jgi:acetyl esterase/lipase